MAPNSRAVRRTPLPGELESRRLRDTHERFGDDPDVARMLLAVGLVHGYKLASQRFDAVLAPLDMSLARYEVLGMLEIAGGKLSLRDLKRTSLVHPATMTYTIDGLRKRGFLTREPVGDEGQDRRMVMTEITPDGREVYARATDALRTVGFGFPDLPAEDAAEIAVLLSRLH